MKPLRIDGATRILGAPDDWDPETQGDVNLLPIRDMTAMSGPVMLSCWELSPDELAKIQATGKVYLMVWGTGHPPVAISVEEPV